MQNSFRLRTAAFCGSLSLAVLSCQSGGAGQPVSRTADEAPTPTPAGSSIADLRAKLRDPEMSVRLAAVEQLGPRAPESQEAVDALVQALGDPAPLVRRFAAYGLSEVKAPAPSMLIALAGLLKDPELEPRDSAARALASLALRVPAEAVRDLAPQLAAAVGDKEESVRAHAVEALGGLGAPGGLLVPAVTPALERALRDPSGQVRGTAAAAIGKLGSSVPGTVALLIQALADPLHDVRKEAVIALEKIGPDAAPAAKALARQLRGKEIYLRVFAADALAAIGPGARAALPELKALAKRGWKDLEGSPEMEAKQLPDAVARAIQSIEAKNVKKERR